MALLKDSPVAGQAFQILLCEARLGLGEEVGGRAALADLPLREENHPVGHVAGGLGPILRRSDAALPGMLAGSKVGHLWTGWLNQNNRGAWRGWVDTDADGTTSQVIAP